MRIKSRYTTGPDEEFGRYSGDMEVNQIKFEGGLPSEVSVTMSIAEAAAIAKVFGKMNGYAHDKLGVALHEGGGPYSVLVDSVFNRYWEEGLAAFGLNFSLETLNTSP